MRRSVPFWIFSLFVGIFLRCLPFLSQNFFFQTLLWYAVLRLIRASGLFFPWAETGDAWRVGAQADAEPWTAVVTGASTGIGAAAAAELTRRGGLVWWLARGTAACEARKAAVEAEASPAGAGMSKRLGPRGAVLRLDLADLAAVKEAADALKSKARRIDALILNAGYHGDKRKTKDGFEMTIGVNHLGHMYFTYLLMDLLKQSSPSRIIVVASDLHQLSGAIRLKDLNFDEKDCSDWATYTHSKLANMLFVKELARRLKDAGSTVDVYAVHPGTPVQSELMRNHGLFGSWVMRVMVMPWVWHLFCRSPVEGAQNLVHAALAPFKPAQRGAYFENLVEVEPSANALDAEAAKQLWDLSCEMLQIPTDWQL